MKLLLKINSYYICIVQCTVYLTFPTVKLLLKKKKKIYWPFRVKKRNKNAIKIFM